MNAQLPATEVSTYIDIPSFAEATPEVLQAFSETVHKAAEAFALEHTPSIESLNNAFKGFSDGATDECKYLANETKGENEKGIRLFPMVATCPGSNEGYYCQVHICRSQYTGFTGATMLSVKFWDESDAALLARHLNSLLCW